MDAKDVAEIVWAETDMLADSKGVDEVRRLLSQLIVDVKGRQFPKRKPLPAANDRVLGEMGAAIADLAGKVVAPAADNAHRLLMWESVDGKMPTEKATLPAPWEQLNPGDDMDHHGRFEIQDRMVQAKLCVC